MNDSDKGPVKVRLHLSTQWSGCDDENTIEIPRDEWDAMTPAERCERLDSEAETFMANIVEYGWHIDDADDMAAAEGGESR